MFPVSVTLNFKSCCYFYLLTVGVNTLAPSPHLVCVDLVVYGIFRDMQKVFFFNMQIVDVVIVTNRSTQYLYFPGTHFYWRSNLGVPLPQHYKTAAMFV